MIRLRSIHTEGSIVLITCIVFLVSTWNSDFEVKRQIEILESGGEVANETRAFDFESG